MVYLVGAGPGDPGLATVKALACIRCADVLVYDRLVSPELVAQARADAEKLYVGKEVGRSSPAQAEINQLLADRAQAGQIVCRLKSGDPFIFGQGAEEAEYLAGLEIPFEVVPGVTSGLAAAAGAGIAVTHRDVASAVTLVTGHDPSQVDWSCYTDGTLLIYMGVEGLPVSVERLLAAGRPAETPVAVVRWGTAAEQQTVTGTLGSIVDVVAKTAIKAPAMIIVGEAVRLRDRLNWAEAKPLFGHRVLAPYIAGTGCMGLPERSPLREAGAEVWDWPVAEVEALSDFALLDAAIGQLEKYQSAIFASPEAVRRFLRRLVPAGRDVSALLHLDVGAADEETAAALADMGLRCDWKVSVPLPGARVLLLGAPEETATLRCRWPRAEVVATHGYRLRTDLAAQLSEVLVADAIQTIIPVTPLAGEFLSLVLAGTPGEALVQ
jgi:uroporphyrinogen III methyltransferase/synthase